MLAFLQLYSCLGVSVALGVYGDASSSALQSYSIPGSSPPRASIYFGIARGGILKGESHPPPCSSVTGSRRWDLGLYVCSVVSDGRKREGLAYLVLRSVLPGLAEALPPMLPSWQYNRSLPMSERLFTFLLIFFV